MRKKLSGQRGFTTVTLMGVLMVGGLLVMAVFTAVNPDIALTRSDQDSKQAYAAAESGLQWYLNSLNGNNSYYTLCDNPPAPNGTEVAPVNQVYPTTPLKTFKWRNLPGEQAKYAIELIPAEGRPLCTTDQYSMVDRYGNLRLRISGRSRGKTRTINATLRRLNFLDYIYFTDFETLDPVATSDPDTAATECAQPRALRDSPPCLEIQFADADAILGPMHTNDNILVCGSPQLGRELADRIEINGPRPVESAGCGSAAPDYKGTLIYPAGELEMPPSNGAIQSLALSGYVFNGRTEIQLNGTSMSVKNAARWPDNAFHPVSLPSNGVIYVANNGACTSGYVHDQTYSSEQAACGNAWVKGTYSQDLTIAAANDIVINGNLERTSDELLLGLVANNFVRVYHPVNWSFGDCGSNTAAALSDPVIEAAILALNHSFIVDNWFCGAHLGDLNVDGAIAQKFRGPVGTTGGSGYLKKYEYNDRLRYREPPYFLDPVQSSWRIARQTESLPSRSTLP
jgi:type II secretory pathway pseudopilin PulG